MKEHVDEQIAHLLETVEPAPAGGREQPRLGGSSGPTVYAEVLRRFRWQWHDIRSNVTYILLGAAAGILIGALLGR
jgi:hypothetical protein